jgi:hypothetical protein
MRRQDKKRSYPPRVERFLVIVARLAARQRAKAAARG